LRVREKSEDEGWWVGKPLLGGEMKTHVVSLGCHAAMVKQIPFGNDNKKSKGKRRSLRDDNKKKQKQRQRQKL